MHSGLTSKMPVADELKAIRRKSAHLVSTLGYKAAAKAIRAGGPLEANLRFVHRALTGRTYTNPVTDAEHRINAKVAALRQGIARVADRVKELGGK